MAPSSARRTCRARSNPSDRAHSLCSSPPSKRGSLTLHSAGSNQPFVIECANTAPATITLRTAFDVAARALYHPMHLWAGTVSPKTPGRRCSRRRREAPVKVQNLSAAGSISAFPAYVYPFDDAANKRFTVQVCQTQSGDQRLPAASPISLWNFHTRERRPIRHGLHQAACRRSRLRPGEPPRRCPLRSNSR